MAGAGYRTFQSGEVLTSTNVQTYLMDQAVQVYSGTAARSSAVPSPSTGMVAYSTATGLQVFNGSAWASVGGATYASISGGASTALGTAIGGSTYNVHTFSADANLVVTTAGLVEVCLIGGGGAGGGARATTGNAYSYSGGGGGGGGVVGINAINTIYLAVGTVAVDVGAGGAGVSENDGAVGFTSAIGNLISAAGGGNGNGVRADQPNGGDGSSGGGSGGKTVASTQGNNGGTSSGFAGGAGGGSPVAVGGNGSGTGNSGIGGAGGGGIDISTFIGGATYYAGAGAGGGANSPAAAPNGGVAGASAGNGNNGVNYGAAGSGGCSGNSGPVRTGGNGAAGVVFVRVKTS